MRTIIFSDKYNYIHIINQGRVKCLNLTPKNEIIFDLGGDSLYYTDPYSTKEQAISELHRLLDNWGILDMNLDAWREKEDAKD